MDAFCVVLCFDIGAVYRDLHRMSIVIDLLYIPVPFADALSICYDSEQSGRVAKLQVRYRKPRQHGRTDN